MLTFSALRELTGRKPAGRRVINVKDQGVKIEIYKYNNEYITYLDGDRLDSYRTEAEAKRMAKEFVKQLGK